MVISRCAILASQPHSLQKTAKKWWPPIQISAHHCTWPQNRHVFLLWLTTKRGGSIHIGERWKQDISGWRPVYLESWCFLPRIDSGRAMCSHERETAERSKYNCTTWLYRTVQVFTNYQLGKENHIFKQSKITVSPVWICFTISYSRLSSWAGLRKRIPPNVRLAKTYWSIPFFSSKLFLEIVHRINGNIVVLVLPLLDFRRAHPEYHWCYCK